MAKSIMQQGKYCYITGDSGNLHKHHIFGGARRKLSEKYGLWVYLRGEWHNQSRYGVHFNSLLNRLLKREAQIAFERNHTREEFMSIFGRNYLIDGEREAAGAEKPGDSFIETEPPKFFDMEE